MLLERNGKLTMWKSKSSRLSYSLVESSSSDDSDRFEYSLSSDTDESGDSDSAE